MSYENRSGDQVTYPLGKNPVGYIMYNDEGYNLTNFDASKYTVDTVSNLIRSGGHCLTGSYFVRYIVKVIQGHHVDSISRIINILDSTVYPCNQSAINGISNQLKDIKLYPNPASQIMNIDAGDQKILNIRIINTLGTVAFDLNDPGNGVIQVPVSQLKPGIYTVVVGTGNGVFTRQIVKN